MGRERNRYMRFVKVKERKTESGKKEMEDRERTLCSLTNTVR